ncbi:MAG: lipid-binding SYLF domain-containing protein [Pirellulaceae bacterium]|nr:lipid-binding SYLF domain-containing protein [Pirellulaceae bacterium]
MLNLRQPLGLILVLLAAVAPAISLRAQSQEEVTVTSASQVLNEIMAIPSKQIPQAMLANAHGIAIVPNVVKGGFVVGVRYGKGLVVVRDGTGAWRPPMFITLTGGSLGWQAGIQATDLILVFKTQKSVQGLMSGKFTIGADASAAAGPVGRQASAATDAQLKSEILSYSRSRGLFAGIALDGTALQVDAVANQVYYGNSGFTPAGTVLPQNAQLPPSAVQLMNLVAQYSGGAAPQPVAAAPGMAPAGAPAAIPASATTPAPPDLAAVQAELAKQSQQLQAMLDDTWKRFLALPPEILSGTGQPSPAAVTDAISRYETVLRDPQYQALTQRPEFRGTLELLRRYREASAIVSGPAQLLPPPPPTGAAPGTLPRY